MNHTAKCSFSLEKRKKVTIGGTSSIVMMNIRYLGKIITKMAWDKIDKRGNIETIYIVKFKNLKINDKGNE